MAESLRQILWRSSVTLVKAVSVCHIVFAYGGFPTQIDGPSMFPTFTGRGEWVLVETLPGLADRVKLGDIVIASRPIAPNENIIKRVTALQGQEVKVYRRGDLSPLVVRVPPGHIWLEGDNLIVSRDSREYGPLPLALVRGRAVAQFWPEVKWLSRKVG